MSVNKLKLEVSSNKNSHSSVTIACDSSFSSSIDPLLHALHLIPYSFLWTPRLRLAATSFLFRSLPLSLFFLLLLCVSVP
ncbi:hypothetical protein CsatB_020134 [Cannabis sativa]